MITAAVLAAVRPHRSAAVSLLSSASFAALALLCAALLAGDGDTEAFRKASIGIVVAATLCRALVSVGAFALARHATPATEAEEEEDVSLDAAAEKYVEDLADEEKRSLHQAPFTPAETGENDPLARGQAAADRDDDDRVIVYDAAGVSPARTPTAGNEDEEVPVTFVPAPETRHDLPV